LRANKKIAAGFLKYALPRFMTVEVSRFYKKICCLGCEFMLCSRTLTLVNFFWRIGSMKLTRLFAFVALLILVMSVGMVSAQDGEVTMIIGWEQEPDIPTPLSNSAFSTYTSYFYSRDVWDFRGEEREIYPIMVEEIPSPDNGLVTTVEVEGGEAPVVTYKLREGMLWSAGEPVTAED
jgi:ABC-type transport system substrate-binding protein